MAFSGRTVLGPDRVETSGGHRDAAGRTRREPEVSARTDCEGCAETGERVEAADACYYLASDRASFVTGQVLHVNGGTYPTPTLVSR